MEVEVGRERISPVAEAVRAPMLSKRALQVLTDEMNEKRESKHWKPSVSM